jgi:hypothetical protein
MIEPLADMPAGTLGFVLSGDVTREEYKAVLLPPIRDAVERGDRIRMLVQIGPEFREFDPGALLEDTKMGLSLGIRHLDAWERTAIVTDVDWIARAAHMFAGMVPGELQVRPLAEADAARVAGGREVGVRPSLGIRCAVRARPHHR